MKMNKKQFSSYVKSLTKKVLSEQKQNKNKIVIDLFGKKFPIIVRKYKSTREGSGINVSFEQLDNKGIEKCLEEHISKQVAKQLNIQGEYVDSGSHGAMFPLSFWFRGKK